MSGHHFGPTGTKGAQRLSTLPRAPGNQLLYQRRVFDVHHHRQTLDGACHRIHQLQGPAKAFKRFGTVWGEEKSRSVETVYLGSPLMIGYWTKWTGFLFFFSFLPAMRPPCIDGVDGCIIYLYTVSSRTRGRESAHITQARTVSKNRAG